MMSTIGHDRRSIHILMERLICRVIINLIQRHFLQQLGIIKEQIIIPLFEHPSRISLSSELKSNSFKSLNTRKIYSETIRYANAQSVQISNRSCYHFADILSFTLTRYGVPNDYTNRVYDKRIKTRIIMLLSYFPLFIEYIYKIICFFLNVEYKTIQTVNDQK